MDIHVLVTWALWAILKYLIALIAGGLSCMPWFLEEFEGGIWFRR